MPIVRIFAVLAAFVCLLSHTLCLPSLGADEPVMVLTGADSHVKKKTFHRIVHKERWKEMWHRHHGVTAQQAFSDHLTEFKVDFKKYEVVVIFGGKSTNQRSLSIDQIIEEDSHLLLRYDFWGYQTSGGSDESSVFAFVVIPKNSKAIRFEENIQGLKDQPAKWKHQVTLRVPWQSDDKLRK